MTYHLFKIQQGRQGSTPQRKSHNLFRAFENSIEQCFAAHIVQCCQHNINCSMLFSTAYCSRIHWIMIMMQRHPWRKKLDNWSGGRVTVIIVKK